MYFIIAHYMLVEDFESFSILLCQTLILKPLTQQTVIRIPIKTMIDTDQEFIACISRYR